MSDHTMKDDPVFAGEKVAVEEWRRGGSGGGGSNWGGIAGGVFGMVVLAIIVVALFSSKFRCNTSGASVDQQIQLRVLDRRTGYQVILNIDTGSLGDVIDWFTLKFTDDDHSSAEISGTLVLSTPPLPEETLSLEGTGTLVWTIHNAMSSRDRAWEKLNFDLWSTTKVTNGEPRCRIRGTYYLANKTFRNVQMRCRPTL